MANSRYQEILKLKHMLEVEKIPFMIEECSNGYRIAYPSKENTVCSVIEHDGSYGRCSDLIEIRGLLTDEELEEDEVVGDLTAEDVFKRIKNHFENANIL